MEEKFFKDDKLSVAIKADVAEEIKGAYCALGWELKEEYDDERYGDLVHMDFTRPHLVAEKDRLQLLQVRLEVAVNFLGRTRIYTRARSVAVGLFFGILGAAFVVLGLLAAIKTNSVIFLAGGVALMSAGVSCWLIAAISGTMLLKKDKERYSALIAVVHENIRSVMSEAVKITGVSLAADCADGQKDGTYAEITADSIIKNVTEEAPREN